MFVARRLAYLLLCSAAITTVSAPAVAQTQRQFDFDLPAQPLSDALVTFSRVTGLQVATSPATLAGLRSGGLRGRMSAAEALRHLTAAATVEAQIVGDTVTIERRDLYGAADATADAPMLADASGDGDIVVTGFRESVARAEQLKRAAVGTQDVILAQDIAAFPDQNLAEALQRVPGIAITRDSGEGRQISLRGLGPDFTRTQLNGMEVLTNTSSGLDSRGTVSRNRSFDYSIFASELFNRVTVEKSYAAEQDEGGIGGTVGLRAAKPFDYPGNTLVVSAKGQVNQYTDKLTPRFVGLASGRWGDVGVLVSAAYSKADTIEWGYRNWNWSQINFGAANVGPGIAADVRNMLVNAKGADRVWNSRAQTYASWFNERERLGITSAFQYHPNDRTDVTLDVLYGRLRNKRETDVLGAAGTNNVSSNDIRGTQVLTGVTIDRYNSITSASFSGVDMRSETRDTRDQTDFWQVALNARTEITDALTASALAGWSKSVFNSSYDQAFLEAVNQSYTFSNLDTDEPRNTYGFDVTDASFWDPMQAQSQTNREFYNAKGELAWAVGGGSTLKAGAAFKQFANGAWERRKTFNFSRTGTPDVPTRLTPYSSFIPYVIADIDGTYEALGLDNTLTAANITTGSDFRLRERSWTGYVQYDLNTTMGGIGLRANAGLRYYRTNLLSEGNALVGTTLTPVSISNDYDGFLPAANVALDLTPSLVFRINANRNLSRPALSDMRAAASISVSNFGGTISAGNPNLKPFIADSVDASLEYYDGQRGSLAIGVFYKKMKSFITTETTPVPYNTTGFPTSLLLPGQDPSIVYNYTRPVNGEGADIKGIELAAKRDFDFLPGVLRYLGALGNVTLADGSTDVLYSGVPVNLPLTALSKLSTNGTIYFDTDRFGIRGSIATRSRYRGGSGGNGNIGEFYTPQTNYDASAYFNVTPQLKLTLEALNISNQRIIQYADRDARRMMTNTVSGRTILFGATMRF